MTTPHWLAPEWVENLVRIKLGERPTPDVAIDPAAYTAALARARNPELSAYQIVRMAITEGVGDHVGYDTHHDRFHRWAVGTAEPDTGITIAAPGAPYDDDRPPPLAHLRVIWRALYLSGGDQLPCWPCFRDGDECEHPLTWPDPWPDDEGDKQ